MYLCRQYCVYTALDHEKRHEIHHAQFKSTEASIKRSFPYPVLGVDDETISSINISPCDGPCLNGFRQPVLEEIRAWRHNSILVLQIPYVRFERSTMRLRGTASPSRRAQLTEYGFMFRQRPRQRIGAHCTTRSWKKFHLTGQSCHFRVLACLPDSSAQVFTTRAIIAPCRQCPAPKAGF